VMIRRPPLPTGLTVVESVDEAFEWVISRGSDAG
jgi:hypothetical protein